MYKSILATTVTGVLWFAGAMTASAGEMTIEMQAIREKGPGPVIGTVHFMDKADGVSLQFDLSDLPPGPNRVLLHDSGDCKLQRDELLSNPLALVDVGIDEDGAESLKKTVVFPGMTLAEMSHKALIVLRGSQTADLDPQQTGTSRLAACGVIK